MAGAPFSPSARAPGSANASNVARVLGWVKDPVARPVAVSPPPRSSGAVPPDSITAMAPTIAAATASTNRRLRTVCSSPSQISIWKTKKNPVQSTTTFTTAKVSSATSTPGTRAATRSASGQDREEGMNGDSARARREAAHP